MRLLSALLALLIAVSVVTGPLPAAFGVAHDGAPHGAHAGKPGGDEFLTGFRPADSTDHDHHVMHGDHAPDADAVAQACAGAIDDLGGVGCCEFAMCHPFVFAREASTGRAPPVAIGSDWNPDTLLEARFSHRIERPPRA